MMRMIGNLCISHQLQGIVQQKMKECVLALQGKLKAALQGLHLVGRCWSQEDFILMFVVNKSSLGTLFISKFLVDESTGYLQVVC
jgi:hypothetical protein